MNLKKILVTIFTVICWLMTMLNVGINFLFYLFYKMQSELVNGKSVIILEGADGPTSIFLANSENNFPGTAIFLVLTIIGLSYLIITRKKVRKTQSVMFNVAKQRK